MYISPDSLFVSSSLSKNSILYQILLFTVQFSLHVYLMQTIVEERDQEKERRWKAEQAVRTLTEELKCLQTRFSEEKDLQNVALHATER